MNNYTDKLYPRPWDIPSKTCRTPDSKTISQEILPILLQKYKAITLVGMYMKSRPFSQHQRHIVLVLLHHFLIPPSSPSPTSSHNPPYQICYHFQSHCSYFASNPGPQKPPSSSLSLRLIRCFVVIRDCRVLGPEYVQTYF